MEYEQLDNALLLKPIELSDAEIDQVAGGVFHSAVVNNSGPVCQSKPNFHASANGFNGESSNAAHSIATC